MTLYTIGCPLCEKLLKRLIESNIPFEICTDEQIMEEKGICSSPILETDEGELLTYVKADKYIRERISL